MFMSEASRFSFRRTSGRPTIGFPPILGQKQVDGYTKLEGLNATDNRQLRLSPFATGETID